MWAAMTSYDRDADDGTGGEGFQNLMRLLLCGPTLATTARVNNVSKTHSAHISTQYANELYWNCETQEYGRMFKTSDRTGEYGFDKIPGKDWFHDDLGSGKVDLAKIDEKSSSTHSSAHCRPFKSDKGFDKKRGLLWGGVTNPAAPGNELFKNFGTKFGYYPCTVMDFLVKANMKIIADGASAVNNVAQSYKNVGIGPQTREDCWEIGLRPDASEPCMLSRNKIAAYFGM